MPARQRRSTGRSALVTLLACAVMGLGALFAIWHWTRAVTPADPTAKPLTPVGTTRPADELAPTRVAVGPTAPDPAHVSTTPAGRGTEAVARIEGRVHARGGAAVAGARVRVELSTADETRTIGVTTSGQDGAYVIEAPGLSAASVGAGQLRVEADAAHFRPGRMLAPLASLDETLVIHVDVRLEQGERLTGRVVDTASKPVGGAGVVLSVANTKDGITTYKTVEEVRTGSDGRFETGFASSGHYHLSARADGIGTAFLEDLELEAGVARNLGELVLKGGPAIAGTVTHEGGEPAVEFELWAIDGNFGNDQNGLALAALKAPETERADGLAYTKTLTDAAGHFALRGLRPGQYALRSPDPHAVLEPHQLRFEPGLSNLGLKLLSSRLVVSVVDENGAPVRAANVRLTELSTLADGSYAPAGVRTQAVRGARALTAFVLDPETPVALEAFTASRTSGEQLVILAQNEFTHEAVVVLPSATARGSLILDVQGADGHALTNLQVSLLSTITKARHEDLGILETDAQGRLPPIPAGTYQLVVGFAPGTDRNHFPVRTSEPVVIANGEPTTLALRARLGGRVALTLVVRGVAPPGFDDLPPPGTTDARQRAFDAKRRSQYGSNVSITPATGGAARTLQFRSSTGAGIVGLLLPGETLVSEDLLEPGTYTLSIESQSFAQTATATVSIEGGQSAAASIAVRAR